MPNNVEFYVPFPGAVSPDAAAADAHLVQWALTQHLLPPRQARYFAAMRLGTCAAHIYPRARGEDLNLAADHMGLLSLANDLVGSTDQARAQTAAAVCRDLLTLFENDHPSRPATPVGAAWCSLWRRLRAGMPPLWRQRILHEHAAIFAAYLDHRIHRTLPTVEQYLQRRRITTGLPVAFAVAERVEHWHAPERFLSTPCARAFLEEVTKIAVLPNDVFAVEREQSRGEVDNLVLVLEAAGRTRAQAIADTQAMVRHASERFLHLTDLLPAHYDDLKLDPAERTAADTYVQAMRHLARGNYDWITKGTARYDHQATTLAISTGYEDAPATTGTGPPPPPGRRHNGCVSPAGDNYRAETVTTSPPHRAHSSWPRGAPGDNYGASAQQERRPSAQPACPTSMPT
ncbi:hypothetical protein AB0O91_00310 [Kitasatospora sp. NPDC089797]|uniref:terpene synthase family protein n=1 Tax=Kitasatospora sp. NPDC089797 TaxID=3155298 RepID=UPI00344493DD